MPKGTLGNLTPADRHGSVQVRSSLFASVLCSPSLFLYLFDVFLIRHHYKHSHTHPHWHFHRHLIWISILKKLQSRRVQSSSFFLHGGKLLSFSIIKNSENGLLKHHYAIKNCTQKMYASKFIASTISTFYFLLVKENEKKNGKIGVKKKFAVN